MLRPPTPTLFPYTTLFRSTDVAAAAGLKAPVIYGGVDAKKYILESTGCGCEDVFLGDRKSTRLNSSHVAISYAVFCLKKKTSAAESQAAHRSQAVRNRLRR